MDEKKEIEAFVNDICLSVFRGRGLKYTGQCEYYQERPNLLLIIFMLAAIHFINLICVVLLPFPLSIIIPIIILINLIGKVIPKQYVDRTHAFHPPEELQVTEFILNMPELSHTEKQVIKKIRLACLLEDNQHLLESVSECQFHPCLYQWSFIEWLKSRITIADFIIVTHDS